MYENVAKAVDAMSRIPNDDIAIAARIGMGTTFLRAGLLKLDGWSNGNTLALFTDEYKLPLLSPKLAAIMAMSAELTLPFLLFAGLATRFSALGMLVMTLVIEIFVYPNAFDTHCVWAAALLYLIKYGAGTLSLDRFIQRRMRMPQAA
jgi:putative oxidoreductase